MLNIRTLSAGRIGDENFVGVITKTVLDVINSLFFDVTNVKTLKPAFIALGDGTGQATIFDTQLEHEIARHPLTQLTQADGVTTALINLPISSSSFSATEIGVFTSDGVLLSRANVELSKNQNSILNIVWALTIQGG